MANNFKDAVKEHKRKLEQLGWVTPGEVVSTSTGVATRIQQEKINRERKFPNYYKKKLTGVSPK